LLQLGYRRIGFVGDSRFWGDLSYSGFERAMRRHGGRINESWLFRSTDIEQMAKAATDFVCENPEQIEVFFCDADVVAMSLLRSLTRVGLKVPDQIGVMSYDGIDFYTQQPPYLTSVRIPYLQMIQTVLLQAEANEFRPFRRQHHFLVGELFRGQTVAQKEGGC
ncbi:MAG: LacI family transcriptional regulator, partial [Lentisphaerae bacterium]